MKHSKVHIAVFLIALAVSLAVLLDARTGSGQSQDPGKSAGGESRVKPTVLARERNAETNPAPVLGPAAVRNAMLSRELGWKFGGTERLGWYLYTSLIKRLLDTEDDPASEGFASALARWQEKSSLKPTGVLDEETLYAIVSVWQERRIKDRTPALPEQLITAPASDFYDPTRLDELRQVERKTYAAYQRMVAAAVADKSLGLKRGAKGQLGTDEKYLKIISSFRSREYQEQLRLKSPDAGRAGLATNSPHFTGRALDLYVGGEPVETKDENRAVQVQTRVYRWLVRNADRFGFRPYFYEPWHWEYVK